MQRRLDLDVELEFVTDGGFTQALLSLIPTSFSPVDPQDVLAVGRLTAA